MYKDGQISYKNLNLISPIGILICWQVLVMEEPAVQNRKMESVDLNFRTGKKSHTVNRLAIASNLGAEARILKVSPHSCGRYMFNASMRIWRQADSASLEILPVDGRDACCRRR